MKNFYQILGNTVLTSVTNMTAWFALIFYAYLQTQAPIATSVISGIFLSLTALSGIWFGSLVDKYKKKTVMIGANLASAFLFAMAFLMYITAGPNAFTHINSVLLWFFSTTVLLGVIIGNIRAIVLPTVVTLLVPEDRRDKANGMAGTANGIGFMVTSVISGLLVAHSGMFWILIIGVVFNLLTALHLALISISEKKIVHSQEDQDQSVDFKRTFKAITAVPGLLALIVFTTFNNFLGGVFMALMDAYGLSLVSVQTWGLLWGFLSTAFILGGIFISKFGLGKNPLKTMFMANIIIWSISCVFTAYPSIILLSVGMFAYLCIVPFIQASEFTIIQKLVPANRQGRVFGFASSVEQAASPLVAFAIGPIAQFFFIPLMTDGYGAKLIGSWYGVGADRGIALVFSTAGVLGLTATLLGLKSKYYRMLSDRYVQQTEPKKAYGRATTFK